MMKLASLFLICGFSVSCRVREKPFLLMQSVHNPLFRFTKCVVLFYIFVEFLIYLYFFQALTVSALSIFDLSKSVYKSH